MRFLCIIELFAGAAIIFWSMRRYYRSLTRYKMQAHETKTFSKFTFGLCFGLMAFFFLGYLITCAMFMVKEPVTSHDMTTSLVFLLGAVFIFVVIWVLEDMAGVINCRTGEIIHTLVDAVEAKDRYTRGHSEHVANLSELLYQSMPPDERRLVNHSLLLDAAILHDIGKIGIPDRVLNKAGMLSEEELEIIQQHPRMGKQILAKTSFADLGDIILYHHERMDGKGYYKMEGGRLPLESRMIAIADTFSALYSDRVYRPRMEFERAIAVLREVAGTQLDRELVELFCTIDPQLTDMAALDLFLPYNVQGKLELIAEEICTG